MRMELQITVLLLILCGMSAAQELRTLSISGTSLTVPAGLLPPPGEPIKCGFPIIAYALGQRAASLDGKRAGTAVFQTRPAMQLSDTRGSFCVHYDTSGSHAPALLDASGSRIAGTAHAYVDSIFSILSYVYPYETSILQYPAPPADDTLGGGPEYDIYVMDLGSTYGFATPDGAVVEGGTSTTFISIDNDFVFVRPTTNRGIPALRVTIAHELHHAIQVGNYGYWYDDPFYYEITSTWMEDVVYPEVNDYYNYIGATWGHYRNPETPFTSNGDIMYSRATWGHYVAKRFGVGVMRETWQNIRSARPQVAIDQTLRAHGSDFGTAYAEWSMWNYFTGARAKPGMYYTDGADYPQIAQSAIEFTGSVRDVSGSLQSLAAHYCLVERGTDTMTVIVSNTDVSGTTSSTNPSLQYTLQLRSTKIDDAYMLTPIGVYGKLNVASMNLWSICYVSRDSAYQYIMPSSLPFPSPFRPGRHPCVYLPVNSLEQQEGGLYIFSASADLVRCISGSTSIVLHNKQVFPWDGRTDGGDLAPTGVYFYVIDMPGMRVKGKIALVRE